MGCTATFPLHLVVLVFYSAIIEHTNQVIFLEDDDVAAVTKGSLTLHRIKRNQLNESAVREVITLKMELQEIMKGKFIKVLIG